ncbi:MAG: hypothetical protein WC901_00860 [Candidatus Margulisiibacteriota bacterium]
MHDPLIEPKPGDVVYGNGKTRVVVRNNSGDIVYYVEEHKYQYKKYCCIKTWRDWCKKNKAVVINEPSYDENEFNLMVEKGTKAWAGVQDVNTWLEDIRGSNESN